MGYAFGQYWNVLLAAARSFGLGIIVLAVMILGLYVYRRQKRRHKSRP